MRSIFRPPARCRTSAIALLASALCLAGCQRSASSGAAAAAAARPPASTPRTPASATTENTPGTVAAPPAPDRPTREPSALPAPGSPAARPAPESPAAPPAPVPAVDTGVFGLLSQGAQDGTLPEDFEIGPLGAARFLGDDERAARDAAASLLDAFARGRVDRAGLAAASRDALAGTIAYAVERGDLPVAWRLGPPRAADSELVMNLRLFGRAGSAEGELYARREGGELRISDLQIDPARMRIRRERSGRTFFPSPYRWLLGG